MPTEASPSRRTFVASAGLATAAMTAGLAGCKAAPGGDRHLQFASLDAAEEELTRLALAQQRVSGAHWNWAQTLVHCAQSIEYSMAGYPQPKSRLFQRTAGAAAFGVFAWRGRMSHDLAEPIPGAPALEPSVAPAEALQRLRASIADFQRWARPLEPHFAYGPLDKPAYELAHAMHLANHFSAFQARG